MNLAALLSVMVVAGTPLLAQNLFPNPPSKRPVMRNDESKTVFNELILIEQKKSRASLDSVARKASRLSESARNDIHASLLYLRRQQGKFRWNQLGYDLRGLRGSEIYGAYLERQAQELAGEKSWDKARAKYSEIARQYPEKQQAAEEKRLGLFERQYQRDSRIAGIYAKALRSALESESASPRLLAMYRRLIARELAAARNIPQADAAVRLAQPLIELLENDKEPVIESTAATFVRVKAWTKAMPIYLDLSLNGSEVKRLGWLKQALACQHQSTGWDVQPPWAKKQTNKRGLEELRSMYLRWAEIDASSFKWPQKAHVGLLHLALGQAANAREYWTQELERQVDQVHAPKALGWLFADAQQRSQWEELEKLARIGLKADINAPNLSSREALARALLQIAKSSLAKEDFKTAITKLEEFRKSYAGDKRMDEASFLLAKAYHGNKQYQQALTTIYEHTEKYPRSSFRSQSLLLGGQWSTSMANEDYTVYFHQLFIDEFPRSSQAKNIRNELIDLFLGREVYANIEQILEPIVMSRKVAFAQKRADVLQLLDIEDRYGNPQHALRIVDIIKSQGRGDAVAMARALRIEGRYHAAKGDYPKVMQAEKQLTSLAGLESEGREYLGELRFLIAQSYWPQNEEELLSAEIIDPLATINKEYQRFQKLRAAFLSVCEATTTAFCPPAQLQIAQAADRLYERLSPVEIAPTLEKGVIDGFEKRKSELLEALADENLRAIPEAQKLMRQGRTQPDWSTQILWENSTDWNFDRVSGEAGDGFIQFEPGDRS